MSLEQLMAMVPLEAALSSKEKGRKSRWEKPRVKPGSTGRWGAIEDKPFLPPPFVDLPAGLTPLQVDRFLREQRFEELQRKLSVGELELGDPDIRPPSPPPVYDKNGARVNTRDVRVRTQMTTEIQNLCEFMINNLPGFVPPPDFKPAKKIRRIEFPSAKYPDYNFMGIIIGPRGCNHKRLEAESGTTISVRGRGTQKEGKRDHQTDEEASMPMHVHIAGDTEESVEKAVALIEPLLDPLHPAHEEFKKRGLEQLALVNGVAYGELDTRKCAVCHAVGHIAAECPDNQELQPFKKPEVRCTICGDMGHVTMDCRFRNSGGPPPPPGGPMQGSDVQKMDSEYRRMMSELTGDTLNSLDAPVVGNDKPGFSPQPKEHNTTPPPGVSPAMGDMGVVAPGTSPYGKIPIPPPPPRGMAPWLGVPRPYHMWNPQDHTKNEDPNMINQQYMMPQYGMPAAYNAHPGYMMPNVWNPAPMPNVGFNTKWGKAAPMPSMPSMPPPPTPEGTTNQQGEDSMDVGD